MSLKQENAVTCLLACGWMIFFFKLGLYRVFFFQMGKYSVRKNRKLTMFVTPYHNRVCLQIQGSQFDPSPCFNGD